jgi:predicted kinase
MNTFEHLVEAIDRLGPTSLSVVIMRGIPGSGKTTSAHELPSALGPDFQANYYHSIVSADNLFYDQMEMTYNYDQNLLTQAHDECFEDFVHHLNQGRNLVIVDNTNIMTREYSRYCELALLKGYRVFFLEFNVGVDRQALLECARRAEEKGIPATTVHDMNRRLVHQGNQANPKVLVFRIPIRR